MNLMKMDNAFRMPVHALAGGMILAVSMAFAAVAQAQDISALEDCLAFSSVNAEVSKLQDRWKLVDGSRWLFDFGSGDEAASEATRALEIIRHYGLDNSCFIGRPDPNFSYLLAQRMPPAGALEGEDCLRHDLDALRVEPDGENWLMTDGRSRMLLFSDVGNAHRTLALVKYYGFTHQCFVGRPHPDFVYWRKGDADELATEQPTTDESITEAPLTAESDGKQPTPALQFTGENSYAQLPTTTRGLTDNFHQTLEFSIGFWVKFGPRFCHQQNLMGTASYPTGNVGWYIRHRGDGEIRVNVAEGTSRSERARIQTGSAPSTGVEPKQWHFFYITGNGSRVALHIDGNLIDEEEVWDDGPGGGSEDMHLTLGGSGEDYMNSSVTLSHLAIWNHQLSDEQMQAHQDLQLTGNEEGLVGFWRLDEGHGQTAHDSSPAGNHFQIHEGEWVDR